MWKPTKEQQREYNKRAYEKRKSNPSSWESTLDRQRKYYTRNGRKKYPNYCIVCKKTFQSVRKDRRFCSKKCISQGPYNGRWAGGKQKTKSGYVIVYAPYHPNATRNFYQEHRIIMEKHLGRFLKHKEHVHHINGNKEDNRIENLEIMSSSEHSKHHWKVKKNQHD